MHVYLFEVLLNICGYSCVIHVAIILTAREKHSDMDEKYLLQI